MSSFTPKEIRGLYSAYAEVHMTEEDHFASSLLEEINAVINHMVDEGWDLSEYTLEELQESFLDVVVLPEIERFCEIVSQLNESTEELTEEQQEEFILEWGWLNALTGISRAKKAADAARAVATATKVKPSILQAPLVGSKPAASSASLQAPVKPVKPTKPLPSGLSVTGGPQKGGIVTGITNWAKGLFKAKPAAPASATPKPVAPKPVGTRTSDVVWSKLKSGLDRLTAPGRQAGPINTFGGIKDKLVGTTKRGLATRTVAATDAYGQLAYPDKNPYSLTGFAAGTLASLTGAALQGLAGAERFGQKGPDGKFFGRGAYETGQRTGLGYAARDAGETLTRAGLGMITQNDSSKQQTPPPAETEAQRRRRLNLPPTSLTQQTQSFEMSGQTIIEEPKWPTNKPKNGDWSKLTLGGVTKIWDPETKSYQLPGTINKRLKAQGEEEIPVPGRVAGYKSKAQIEAEAKAKAEAEAKAKANQQSQGGQPPATTQPPVKPEKPAEPKPVTVKSTRQQELDKISADKTLTPERKWEIANPGLAAARRERKAIRGTSETDNPLMQGLRSGLPAAKTALDTTAFKADLAKSGIKPSAYSSLLNNPRRMKYQQPSVEKEAYDVVLDYLLSEGHADTVEEAHYVMMQLDAENIQSIVAESGYFPTKESQRRDREKYNLSTGDLPDKPRKPIKRKPDGSLKTEQMMPPINPVEHKQAQKTQKIYNLGKGTNNPNEAQSAMKRTGPQLPGV